VGAATAQNVVVQELQIDVEPEVLELRTLRLNLDLTLQDVGRACFIRPSQIAAYENGTHHPRLDTYKTWATALGISILLTPISNKRLATEVITRLDDKDFRDELTNLLARTKDSGGEKPAQ
jgi:transcriptional regulator with XRE-family HTH domain